MKKFDKLRGKPDKQDNPPKTRYRNFKPLVVTTSVEVLPVDDGKGPKQIQPPNNQPPQKERST